jgi:hypothetical protein
MRLHPLDRPAKSVEILGDRWCLLLVGELLRWVDRFNELERSVPGSPGRCWPSACGTWSARGWWTGRSPTTGRRRWSGPRP